ncbi:MAG: hypothetical protein K5765_01755 [Clostridia bacterium]|nr:hypothetical protein [Clostridia bacterium]
MGFYDSAYKNIGNQTSYAAATVGGYLLQKAAIKNATKDPETMPKAIGETENSIIKDKSLNRADKMDIIKQNRTENVINDTQITDDEKYGMLADIFKGNYKSYNARYAGLAMTEQIGQQNRTVQEDSKKLYEILQNKGVTDYGI